MNTKKRNKYGMFDVSLHTQEKEVITLSRNDIERQLDAGAFVMSREDAIAAGFLSPHEEPDTVIVDVREAV